jgi:hypothetical protein
MRFSDCASRNRSQHGRISGANVFLERRLNQSLHVFRIPIHNRIAPKLQ